MRNMKWIMAGLVLALATPAAHALRAGSLQAVRAIWVDADVCPMGISQELADRGFMVTPSRRHADAILEVDMTTNGRYLDPDSVEKGRYTARLVGDDGEVLFHTAGYETDHDLDDLCEEVGNEIADSLEDVVEG
jgi:hypothetical protein